MLHLGRKRLDDMDSSHRAFTSSSSDSGMLRSTTTRQTSSSLSFMFGFSTSSVTSDASSASAERKIHTSMSTLEPIVFPTAPPRISDDTTTVEHTFTSVLMTTVDGTVTPTTQPTLLLSPPIVPSPSILTITLPSISTSTISPITQPVSANSAPRVTPTAQNGHHPPTLIIGLSLAGGFFVLIVAFVVFWRWQRRRLRVEKDLFEEEKEMRNSRWLTPLSSAYADSPPSSAGSIEPLRPLNTFSGLQGLPAEGRSDITSGSSRIELIQRASGETGWASRSRVTRFQNDWLQATPRTACFSEDIPAYPPSPPPPVYGRGQFPNE